MKMPQIAALNQRSLAWLLGCAVAGSFTAGAAAQQYPQQQYPQQQYPQQQPPQQPRPQQQYPQQQYPQQQYPQQQYPQQQQPQQPRPQQQYPQQQPPPQQQYPQQYQQPRPQQQYPQQQYPQQQSPQQQYPQPQQQYPQPQPYPPQPGYPPPPPGAYNPQPDPYAQPGYYQPEPPFPPMGMQSRLGVGAKLYFGGEAELETGGTSEDSDMLTTLGLFVSFEAPLHRYFTLGGELGWSLWNAEAADDADVGRSMVFDLLARPKVRYPFVFQDGGLLELYAVLPIGANLSILNGDIGGAGIDKNAGVGFTVGFSAGVTYWLSTSVGLSGEFGFLSHSLSNELEAGGMSQDLDISFGQWGFNLGAQFAL